MSEQLDIPAQLRDVRGKGASRRLRRQGLVPGILYGGDRDPVALQITQQFLQHVMDDEGFYTTIQQISVDDGRKQKVIVRDLQRHPFKSEVMHIDFQRISDTEKLNIRVPLHFLNEEKSPAGKKSSVVIAHQITDVEILCLPKDLPEFLSLDLADMDVGDSRNLSDIETPEGVEIVSLMHDEDLTVVSAAHVAEETVETEEDEDLAVGAAAAEDGDEADDEGEGSDEDSNED